MGSAASDVRVEFVARRVLPQSRIGAAGAVLVPQAEPDDAWRALLRATGEIDSDGSHRLRAAGARRRTVGQFAYEIRIFIRGTSCSRIRWSWGC